MTKQMTFAALSWLRYEKNCDIVCTEVGQSYLKDVFGLWIGEDGLPAAAMLFSVGCLEDMSKLKAQLSVSIEAFEKILSCDRATEVYTIVIMKKLAEQALANLRVKK